MREDWTRSIPFWVSMAIAAVLGGFGVVMLIDAPAGELVFGTSAGAAGNYAFHFALGVREILLAAIIAVLCLAREIRMLAVFMLMQSVVPLGDFLIVVKAADGGFLRASVHLAGTTASLVLGFYLIRRVPEAG